MLPDPDLPNPQQNSPEAEHHGLKPHDLKIIPRIGPPMSRMAADSRRISVPGGVLLAINSQHGATWSQARFGESPMRYAQAARRVAFASAHSSA